MGPMPTMECHSAFQRRDILTPATQHSGQRAEDRTSHQRTHTLRLSCEGPEESAPQRQEVGGGCPRLQGQRFLGTESQCGTWGSSGDGSGDGPTAV